MRALLGINVLIALLDADHLHHTAARSWLGQNAAHGWSSCPLTQNGCLRVMSLPAYPNPLPVGAVIERLGQATRSGHHAFWPDDVSLLDDAVADAARIHGSRQVTDLYLLALAVAKGGRFVTLDGRVPLSAVRGAAPEHLVVI
jgi:toxin-antitoxin system PIN domain toxin